MWIPIIQLHKYFSMSCNKCNNCLDVCDCNCTTTTTCSPVAEQPCITICSDIYASECIIYDGEDNECYGVKKGDTIKDIIDKIIAKITPDNCSCQYGSAIIDFITTTTSTSTTTSTTTIPQNNLCFTLYQENNCNFTVQEIISGAFVNGKESYSFTYNSIDYTIRWSIVDERWELYLATYLAFPLAYLESDSEHPIAPLKGDILTQPELSWTMYGVDSILVTTRECCPEELCVLYTTKDDSSQVTIKSQYDTIASLPSQPLVLKHSYIGCIVTPREVFKIEWNIFTGKYELTASNGDPVGYTLEENLETTDYINWIITAPLDPFVTFKTKAVLVQQLLPLQ